MNPEFIQKNGWKLIASVGEDMSPRKYYRVEKDGRSAIFMDCSGGEIPGHRLSDYLRIAEWLRSVGLRAPEVYETDEKKFAVVEDFGDVSFKKAIEGGADARGIYKAAVDVLKVLRGREDFPPLPDYYKSHVHEGRRRVIDWYAPIVHQKQNPDGWVEAYIKAWGAVEKKLPWCPQGFLHVDFHAENLMKLPGEGIASCGILDFQGAMMGPLPYDLANLLEDPRTDVPAEIRAEILKGEDEAFRAWYRVLAMQFHCRVIGQYIKLAIAGGKTGYLQFIPRTEFYIREGLKDPLLAPVKSFFADIKLDFHSADGLNSRLKAGLIRPDAF